MDDSQQNAQSVAEHARATAERLRILREQTAAELTRHQETIEAVEQELGRRVAELAASYHDDGSLQEAYEAQQSAIAHYEEQIGEFEQRTSQLQATWDAQLAERDATIAELQNRLDERDRRLGDLQEQLDGQIGAQQAAANQREQQYAELQDRAAALQQELQAVQGQNQADVETLQTRLTTEQDEHGRTRELLAAAEQRVAAAEAEHSTEAEDGARLREQLATAEAALEQVRGELATREQEAAQQQAEKADEGAEIVALRDERDALAARCHELEQQAEASDSDDATQLSDLERRYELALEDLRQVKQEKEVLEEQLNRGALSASVAIDGNDWQAQKARLLAELEGESDDEASTPDRQAERLRIEEAIAATDEAVSAKERQIAELNQRVEELAATLESMSEAPDAEAVRREQEAEILDADAVVLEERARLTALQEEWAEKVRNAELELSVERAKLARERASMEETLAAAAASQELNVGDGSQPRRRWLAALGLGESDEDPSAKE